jgi:feruloyl esterase
VVSKAVVKEYYSRPASKAYYVGCSTGGRQGFKMITDFPDDFDGVLAGAPAIDFNHLSGWRGILSRYNGAPSGTPTISVALWEVVRLDIISQCDNLDGVEDGIIDDPDLCDYDPKGLICDAQETEADKLCLNESRVEIVRKVFSPLLDEDGELLYPRYDPGTSLSGTTQGIFGGKLFPYSLVGNPFARLLLFTIRCFSLPVELLLVRFSSFSFVFL